MHIGIDVYIDMGIDRNVDINMCMYLDRDRYSHRVLLNPHQRRCLQKTRISTEITIGQAQRLRDFGTLCLNGM